MTEPAGVEFTGCEGIDQVPALDARGQPLTAEAGGDYFLLSSGDLLENACSFREVSGGSRVGKLWSA